jgi:hypothetical protein
MYIRSSSQADKKTKQVYTTYRLVESYRNQDGKVRQQTLYNLGCHFDVKKEDWKILADRIESILKNQQSLFELDKELEKKAQSIAKAVTSKWAKLVGAQKTQISEVKRDLQTVDINSLTHQDIRKIGNEHVGYHAAKQLKFDEILENLDFNPKQIELALGSVIGRLANPGSELSTHHYLTEHSGIDELLETDFSGLSLKKFYAISDKLLEHKEAIEKALYKREKDLFDLDEIITLYDLTNTYFEGRCLSNPKAQYGRSKEKRDDCCLVSLGLLLDSSGFPKKSKIFQGNVSEPKTLEEMLSAFNHNKKTIVVMDAGIATEDNIAWLKSSGYKYIVVSRKQNLVMPNDKDTVVVKQTKNNLVKASLIENKETDELELYCHSEAKAAKTKQMQDKSSTRYEMELQKLSEGLHKKGCAKKYDKVMERLGRLKEKYKKIGKYYDVSVKTDDKNKIAIEITWVKKNSEEIENQRGIYCLRTNQQGLDEETFWNIYTTLTELESSFRSLKSELGFRPVYHQKESRVDGHLFISILAYHLVHTIRYQLKMHNINENWNTLRNLLNTQCRITSTIQLENKKTVRIRKTTSPDANQLEIYKALGIETHPCKTEKTYF